MPMQFLKQMDVKNDPTNKRPDLVVMGRGSCAEGCGFESLRRILDGLFTLICCKNCVLMFT